MTAALEVGLCLPQFTAEAGTTLAAARTAEADGYAAVSLFDHLRPLGGPPGRPILECLTTLTAVAAATSRVRVLPLVLRASLRPAATVGAVFRTLALLAPGRMVCVAGGGDKLNEAEDLSVGLPALAPAQRREALGALVEAMRHAAPAVPVWIGGSGAALRAMAGERADGWNVWGATADVLRAGAVEVRAAALRAGRDTPRITWAGQVLLADTDGHARGQLADWGAARNPAEVASVIVGDGAAVADQLHELAAAGARTVMLSFVGPNAARARRSFAQTVLPVVAG